jgi:hypothetical protein
MTPQDVWLTYRLRFNLSKSKVNHGFMEPTCSMSVRNCSYGYDCARTGLSELRIALRLVSVVGLAVSMVG